mgnify:FL=1|jgi:hypothetical protein
MAGAFPVKALVQPTGDVVLGEFLESDYVGILDGGTGAGGNGGLAETATTAEKEAVIKEQVRVSFDLLKFETYSTLAELQAQPSTVGKLAQHGTTLYYSTGSSWFGIGTPLAVDTNITGNIEFGGSINSNYDAATNTTSVSVDFSETQSEIDATQLGAGLNVNGSYTTDASSNFLTTSTSLRQAEGLLDAALYAERTRAIGVESTIISDLNTVESDLSNFSYTGHTTAQVTTAGKTSLVYDTNTGKFTPTDNLGTGGFIRFTMGNGTRDDIPLTTSFTGNEITTGRVDFFKADGTQDNIDLIINGV